MLNGFLVLNKALGCRCTDLVRRCSRLTGQKKVGHAGTLDSTAQGLVVMLFGPATRLTEAVMEFPKTYEATVRFGWETDTDDASGAPTTERRSDEGVTFQTLERALLSQMGLTAQEPPRISALRVDGQRAHKLARGGAKFEFRPRFVENRSFSRPVRQPDGTWRFLFTCHRGGYLRSVARLAGRWLGCGAHLAALRRLSLGPLTLEGALDSETLSEERIRSFLRPAEELVRFLPHCEAGPDVERRLCGGLPQWFDRLPPLEFSPGGAAGPVAVLTPGHLSLCDRCLDEAGKVCLKARANVAR